MTPTWGLLHISHWLHPKLKNKGSRHQSSLSIIRKPPLTPPPPSGLDLDSLKNSFKAFHTLLCINLIIDSTGKVLKLSSVRWLNSTYSNVHFCTQFSNTCLVLCVTSSEIRFSVTNCTVCLYRRNAISIGLIRGAGLTGTSACRWKIASFSWTTPFASSASSRSVTTLLSASILTFEANCCNAKLK